jgi:hypothetical protein
MHEPLDLSTVEGLTVEEQQAAMNDVPATIDEVFDVLERAGSAEWVQVDYDPDFGYPRVAFIDDHLSSEDDELEIRVSLLRVADPAAPEPVEPNPDTAAVIAAAVGAHTGNRGDYDVFHVVNHLGWLGDHLIELSERSRPIAPDERAPVEAALRPDTVVWVPDLHAVVGDSGVIAEREAVITLTEPIIDGSVAELTIELWCGMDCAGALTHLVERSAAGQWVVIGDTGGWVS